jgi:hypothetical protein
MTGIVDFRTALLDEDGNPINSGNPLPTTGGGGGGGGGSLSDTVFVDSTGQLFVYRDTGSGTPGAFAIPAWTSYTPTGDVTVSPVKISGTSIDVVVPVHDEDAHLQLSRIINVLSAPQGYDRSAQRQRVTAIIESGIVTTVSAVTTVATVTTVTGLTNIDGRNGAMLINQSNLDAWASCVRARIS